MARGELKRHYSPCGVTMMNKTRLHKKDVHRQLIVLSSPQTTIPFTIFSNINVYFLFPQYISFTKDSQKEKCHIFRELYVAKTLTIFNLKTH